MISTRFRRSRPAYTLLEVIVASAIALIVLIALYTFMEVCLREASEGREAVERATLARGIINRLHSDLTPSITPPGAKAKQKTTNQNANQPTTTTTADPDATTPATPIPLQAGVIGTADVLTIYTTRVPDPKYVANPMGDSTGAPVPSDIRRIAYWIGENGGLCRQELSFVTGEQVYNVDGPIMEADKTEKDYLIAGEVIAVGFEYYDINAMTDDGGWSESWDGRDLGPDQLTPKGPPSAIRVSFTIKFKNARGEDSTKDYRHVIPIVTASGPESTTQLENLEQ